MPQIELQRWDQRRSIVVVLGLAYFLSAFVTGDPDSLADEPENDVPLVLFILYSIFVCQLSRQ